MTHFPTLYVSEVTCPTSCSADVDIMDDDLSEFTSTSIWSKLVGLSDPCDC